MVQSRHERSRRAGTGQSLTSDTKYSSGVKQNSGFGTSLGNSGTSGKGGSGSKKRTTGIGNSGTAKGGSNTSPLNPAKNQLSRAGGQTEQVGSTSFFGLSIGSAPSSYNHGPSSNVATPTGISRPTSPAANRRGGGGGVGGSGSSSAANPTPNLLSRATSLSSASRSANVR